MRVSVNYFFENTNFRIKKKNIITSWIKSIIKNEKKKTGTLNFVFCNDSFLFDLNKKYLKRKNLTDVIAFDYSEANTISGDIFISIERIKENSEKQKTTFINELFRVMAHGVLHLEGYSDKDKRKKLAMTKKENIYINNIYKIYR